MWHVSGLRPFVANKSSILNFQKFEILTATGVKKLNVRRRAKSGGYRSNRC